MTVPAELAPANLVPAAAVIRGERALYSKTGRKGSFGENWNEHNEILNGNFKHLC